MAETEAEEDEGQEMERDSDRETPRGAWVEVIRMGGVCPPWRKTRITWNLPLNVRTCCFRESMDTSCITMMGRTWKGDSWKTLYGSIVGAGYLHSQK